MKESADQSLSGRKNRFPRVSVIVPHLRGYSILRRSIASLSQISYGSVEILVIDNFCEDGSIEEVKKGFPGVQVISAGRNLGFAGACNLGLRRATGDYALLFNDDAEVTPGFLEPLVEMIESDPQIAACQPKIRSFDPPERFDYAGAAGGLLDAFGFPFCRGRIFETLENDNGQYDAPYDIFWASGACCLLRLSAVREVGLLDEDFFAHMEEIDLSWRLHLSGYHVVAVPASIVHHDAGSTLKPDVPLKVYLNHRNSLVMLLKNYSITTLAWVLPVRFLLDLLAFIYRFLRFDFRCSLMVLRASAHVITHLRSIYRRRKSSQTRRRLRDSELRRHLYRRSIVWDYFVLRRKVFSELPTSSLS